MTGNAGPYWSDKRPAGEKAPRAEASDRPKHDPWVLDPKLWWVARLATIAAILTGIPTFHHPIVILFAPIVVLALMPVAIEARQYLRLKHMRAEGIEPEDRRPGRKPQPSPDEVKPAVWWRSEAGDEQR